MDNEQHNDNQTHNDSTPQPEGSTAAAAGAAGESAPAAGDTAVASQSPASSAVKKPRFTIKSTQTSGPVLTYAGVTIDDGGIGRADIPGIAYHCFLEGYEVFDGENDDKPYTGAPAPKKPVNQPTAEAPPSPPAAK